MVKKLSIEDMREVANQKGGWCLSDEYINSKTKLTWKCSEGHTWEAMPTNVKKGSWCPYCAGNIVDIDSYKNIAKKKGGVCLSDNYINSSTKLTWQCKEGHIWEATPDKIKQGRWCPTCAGKRYDIDSLHQFAKSKDGSCLAEEYINSKVKIPWQCNKGHIFETPFSEIVQGSWCPYCAGRYNHSIEKMQEIAKGRGGECLSNSYKGVFTKLKWKCANGHVFESIPKHVISGHWCPNCTVFLNEQRCRYIFETLFDRKFIKNRSVLDGFELDGYNEELQLAFEYHGKQHFEHVDFFYSNGGIDIKERMERDRYKEKRCEELGIDLIVIPYTISPEEHVTFITSELAKRGFTFKVQPKDITFDNYYPTKQELEEIQDLAKRKGGTCLSDVYINIDNKMDFICKRNHHFSMSPYNVKAGKWCRECYYIEKAGSSQRFDSNVIYQIAAEKGWECLSKEYKNARTKLKWKCAKGHLFERTLGHVKEGRGCPVCRKIKC